MVKLILPKLAPWLAAEIPNLIEKGLVTHKEELSGTPIEVVPSN